MEEIIMSYHNNITFTELTPDDITTHEDIYIDMLVGLTHKPCSYWHIYREYAIKEILKAKQLFQKTFE